MAAPNLINRYAGALIESARRHGFDDETIRRNVGVALHRRTPSFSPEDCALISRQVKLMMQDEACGLTPRPIRIGSFRMMCRVAAMSGTLGAALINSFELYRLFSSDIAFGYRDGAGDLGHIRVKLAHPEFDSQNLLPEWWILLWACFSGWLIGEEIPILAADLPHKQLAPLAEYYEVMSPVCRFGQSEACMTFDRRFLARRIIRRPEEVKNWQLQNRIDLVTRPGVERNIQSLIQSKLRNHLREHERMLSIEEVADDMGVSAQTVRRRLEARGASYRQIKEEVRREAVIQWLQEPEISIGEISMRAGFAEPNGLFRAVRSWVGVSPNEYRQRILSRSDHHRRPAGADGSERGHAN